MRNKILKAISKLMESISQEKQKVKLNWYAWSRNDFNFNGISDYLEKDGTEK